MKAFPPFHLSFFPSVRLLLQLAHINYLPPSSSLSLSLLLLLPLSLLSPPPWAAELTAHLALTHRAHSELGEINSDKHFTWLLY